MMIVKMKTNVSKMWVEYIVSTIFLYELMELVKSKIEHLKMVPIFGFN